MAGFLGIHEISDRHGENAPLWPGKTFECSLVNLALAIPVWCSLSLFFEHISPLMWELHPLSTHSGSVLPLSDAQNRGVTHQGTRGLPAL